MTIDEAVYNIQWEKQQKITCRFPCRAFLVKNIAQYKELLDKLQSISGVRILPSKEICKTDIMPQYTKLTEKKYQEQWIILTGVSEYLRLFSEDEIKVRRLISLWKHHADADSTGRILIPLWGCDQQWYDPALGLQNDRQQDFTIRCGDSKAPEQKMEILVLSNDFQSDISDMQIFSNHVFYGILEMLEYWERPGEDTAFTLITKRFRSVQPIVGNVTIRLIDSRFSFICAGLSDGKELMENDCPEDAQKLLLDGAMHGQSLDDAILHALNIMTFNSVTVMAQWKAMPLGKRQLVRLWVMRHQDGSYLYHCFQIADSLDDLEDAVLLEIFRLRHAHPAWVPEYQALCQAMGLKKTGAFFTMLDSIPIYTDRLPFLTKDSREERIYLLRMVGNWLRENAGQVYHCEALRNIYPELYAYLGQADSSMSPELSAYFSRYKTYKLANTLPPDDTLHFNSISLENYDNRYTRLHTVVDDDTFVLWIDALGVEWLSLLLWALQANTGSKMVSADVTCANLPTETCYNEQWKQMPQPYAKKDKLDKLAHKGVIDEPDYYACVEEQISFVTGIAEEVRQRLLSHHRVVITGDHGTSRLAARFFHMRPGEPVPSNAKSGSHGRYCIFEPSRTPVSLENTILVHNQKEGTTFAVFQNYNHFVQSGFATSADEEKIIYGEIHGGATPEEALVPVIVVDSKYEIPLTGEWVYPTVKISGRKATAIIRFNRKVTDVDALIGSCSASAAKDVTGKEWTLVFSGISKGTYAVSLKADGKLVELPTLTVKSALGDDEDDLL